MENSRYLILAIGLFLLSHDLYIIEAGEISVLERLARSLSNCPYDWSAFGGKCYGLFSTSRVTWETANERCLEKGASMVSIHNAEEQEYIRDMIMGSIRTDVWIGLSERISSSSHRLSYRGRRTFRWSDHSALDFTDWMAGEPNNPEEQCVHMWFREDTYGPWNDVPCDVLMGYICQIPTGDYEEGVTPSPRPSFLSGPHHAIVTIGDSITFQCYMKNGGEFEVSWKKGESTFIFTGQQKNTEDAIFQKYTILNETSLHITAVQPSDAGKYSCIINTDPPMHLSHHLRVTSHPSPVHRCNNKSEKWMDLGGDNCYIIETKNEVLWSDAVYNCYKEGGSLTSFHSSEEVKRVLRHLKYNVGRLHIGLRKHNDGSFEWVDKSPLDYRNWDRREPNDRDDQCVEIYTESGKWNDVDCGREMGYICSSPKGVTPVRNSKVCPTTSSKWNGFEGDLCYIVEPDSNFTWSEASQHCSEEGGSLASFHSIEELSVLLQHTKSHYTSMHIALRENTDGTFEWSDKSPLDLIHWDFSEPNGHGNQCGKMNSFTGKWGDSSCDNTAGYICSVEKVDAETSPHHPLMLTDLTSYIVCGEEINSDNGTIHSPNYPESYRPNENCLWKVTVSEDYQVALNFHIIEMEYSADCQYDYVEILDGDRSVKLCGSLQPQTVFSASNEISIKFLSDDTREAIGFFADFTKVEKCGGNIVAEDGVLQTRNYPENYLPNDVCLWKITVPDNYKVHLKFKAFELEEMDGCSYDNVRVIDGHDETSPVLGRFCGSEIPSDIISSGHKIMVSFTSDYGKEYYGFSAEFSKTSESPTTVAPTAEVSDDSHGSCGGDITAEKEYLLSPNYPTHYGPYQTCIWRITVPNNYRIFLKFKTFSLEGQSECSYDYVEIRDGYDDSSTLLGKFCGNRLPTETVSSGNEMFVKFKSDSSNEFRGFAASFKKFSTDNTTPEITHERELCGEDITSDEGIVKSPNFPENYVANEKCSWRIAVSEGHQISLKFTTFKVETHDECNYDYVEIRDGHNPNSHLLAKLCGYDIPQDIVSSTNKLMVIFKSDSTSEYSGFSAEFKKVLVPVLPTNTSSQGAVICGGNYTDDSGVITSPNYPEMYPEDTHCIWKITAGENQYLILTIDTLSIEYGSSCQFDYLEVLDTGHEGYGLGLRRLCGEHHSEIIRSTSNSIIVNFATDNSFESSGFTARFHKVDRCGSDIIAEQGVIQSTDYLDKYESGEMCKWTITVPENYSVALTFTSFNVHYNDRVEVVDEYVGRLGTYQGSENPFSIFSVSNKIEIRYSSDYSDAEAVFSAEFIKAEICGANIAADEGIIQSPNHPDNYEPGQICRWTITVPQGYKVLLNFLSLDVDCIGDKVKVTDYQATSGEYCGSDIPSSVLSTSNMIEVQFYSDASGVGKGFSAEFKKDMCGGEITAESGSITSENYPSDYHPNSECIWNISVPENHVVVLQFEEINIEACTECNCDYVEIKDGHEPDSPQLGKFCHSHLPETISSSTEKMTVKFRSDSSVQNSGFKANFHKGVSTETELSDLLRQFPSLILKNKEGDPKLSDEKEPNHITRLIRSILKK